MSDLKKGMSAYIKICANKPDVYTPDMCAEDLLEYLDSEGGVIKASKEMPNYGYDNDGCYLEVEPLTKND